MKHVKKVFSDKVKRGWGRIYITIDLHDTIIEGKYNLNNDGANFYPNAINVLKSLSYRTDICLILWTSSHTKPVKDILDVMDTHGVKFEYFNENPECPSTELCDFTRKFYFNILIDDKSGWDGMTDWFLFEETLREIGVW